jgi:hypothetical protein
MQNVPMEAVNKNIVALEESIAASPFSPRRSEQARNDFFAMMQDMVDGVEVDKNAFNSASEVMARAEDQDKLNKLLETRELFDLDMLMIVDTKYVITDHNLVSPSGFSMSDRVFIQTGIAIHCDTIPARLPQTNKKLRAFNIDEAAK